MKLAEALNLRSDCQKKIQGLKARLVASAQTEEGKEPPENPEDLIQELETVVQDLEFLIQRINRTNAHTLLTDGQSLTDALAARDVLSLKRSVYVDVAEAASTKEYRYSRRDFPVVRTVNVASLRQTIDQLSRDFRVLDTRIQERNWTVDLL